MLAVVVSPRHAVTAQKFETCYSSGLLVECLQGMQR